MLLSPIGIFLAVAAGAATAYAGDSCAELCQRANAAERKLDSRAALELYLAADKLQPNQPKILQEIARQYSDLVVDVSSEAEKKNCAQQALAYAERAVALDPHDAVNVLSLAVCHGTLAEYSDTSAKIKYSRLVKEETERALALDPNYAWAHHLLGRWNFEVASLGRTKKLFVTLIYGGLPDASTHTGVTELERAVALSPQEVSHQIELGFAYLADGQKSKGRAELSAALTLPSQEKHDEWEKARARAALANLES